MQYYQVIHIYNSQIGLSSDYLPLTAYKDKNQVVIGVSSFTALNNIDLQKEWRNVAFMLQFFTHYSKKIYQKFGAVVNTSIQDQ